MAYGRLCEKRGQLGCFVQLGVRLLGDSFPRFAYSSTAERSNDTGIQRLVDAGIDTDRLLRGLTMEFSSSVTWPVSARLSRVARASLEAEDPTPLAEQLEARSQDPSLDDLNRLNATITLESLLRRSAAQDGCAGDCAARRATGHLLGLQLTPLSRRWVQTFGKD